MREWEAKFGEYVAARSGGLVRFAYLLCGDWHRAEDTVQRVLTKLYLAWNRLDHTEVIDAYVPAIVVRMLARHGQEPDITRPGNATPATRRATSGNEWKDRP